MGDYRHHAILVTSSDHLWIQTAADRAASSGCTTAPATSSPVNFFYHLVIVPDGSKENRAMSEEGDAARDRFITWLKPQVMYCDWVEISYGGESDAQILREPS